jgi:hypothetical protein
VCGRRRRSAKARQVRYIECAAVRTKGRARREQKALRDAVVVDTLYLPYAGANAAIDSDWTLKVKHYTVSKISTFLSLPDGPEH